MSVALSLLALALAIVACLPRRLPEPVVARLAPARTVSAARHAGRVTAPQRLAAARAARAGATAAAAALVGAPAGVRASLLLALAGALYGGVAWRRDVALAAARRHAAIERELPDALDLLAGATDAGAPLDAALVAVTERCHGALREELAGCVARLHAGGPRRDAFLALQASGAADLARVGGALATADELGAPLARLLREQASLQRELRRLRVRERAARATPKIALVVSFLLVPAGLLLILGAQVLQMLEAAGSA